MGDARKMNTPGRNSESSIHTERVFSVLLQEWHPRRVNFYNFSSRPENTIFGRVSAGYAPEHTCAAGPKNEDFWRSYMANARKMADLEKIGCPKNRIFGSDILGNMGGSCRSERARERRVNHERSAPHPASSPIDKYQVISMSICGTFNV